MQPRTAGISELLCFLTFMGSGAFQGFRSAPGTWESGEEHLGGPRNSPKSSSTPQERKREKQPMSRQWQGGVYGLSGFRKPQELSCRSLELQGGPGVSRSSPGKPPERPETKKRKRPLQRKKMDGRVLDASGTIAGLIIHQVITPTQKNTN